MSKGYELHQCRTALATVADVVPELSAKLAAAEKEVAGCRDLIATQRTRIAEAEQENARLREGIANLFQAMETIPYAEISRHWAMSRLDALLAKQEGAKR